MGTETFSPASGSYCVVDQFGRHTKPKWRQLMHSSLTDHQIARRYRRSATTGLSVLGLAGLAVGTAAGSAQASAHTAARAHPAGLADRILEVLSTGNAPGASATQLRQYTDPQSGVRYLLLRQYAGRSLNYTSWEADTPRPGDKRSIEQVNVNQVAKTYSEQTRTKPGPTAPSFGIESNEAQVKQAIREGKATQEGATRIDGREVLKLKISPQDKAERHVYLYVSPSTYRPEQETKTYTSGRYTFHYFAHFAVATPRAVSQVEAKPGRPPGDRWGPRR
jgi:hypothetical protein